MLVAAFVLIAGAHLAAAEGSGLGQVVAAHLKDSGVESSVTAVLLNFRSLDTLFEVTVLAAAAVGVASLPPSGGELAGDQPQSPQAAWIVPRIVPVGGVVVVYLLWAGSSHAGGAFQAGTLFAGVLLLLAFAGQRRPLDLRSATAERFAMVGPLLFAAVAAVPLLGGLAFLQYPSGWDKPLILLLEAALTVSIGAGLALLAAGGRTR